ncbi:hypothetical protein B0J14DRAFT_88089 [Halenospora varia]|nr:hypothetical protein B0J14DRAFT_88089 [Halenospora varia]
MAPRPPKKHTPGSAAIHHEEEEDEHEHNSQENEPMEVLKRANNVVINGNKRREIKRKAIETEHEQRVKEVRAKIESLHAARQTRVTKIQNDAREKLEALNSRRESLEKQVLASMMRVESQTKMIATEMDAMFSGRLEDLEEDSLTTRP